VFCYLGISSNDVANLDTLFNTLKPVMTANWDKPPRGENDYDINTNRPNSLDDARDQIKRGGYCLQDEEQWPDEAWELFFDTGHVLFCQAFFVFCDAEDNIVPHCASKHCAMLNRIYESLFANCESTEVFNQLFPHMSTLLGFINAGVRQLEGERAKELAKLVFEALLKNIAGSLTICPVSSLYWYVIKFAVHCQPPASF
jgi:hypothetical protein